MCSEDRLGVEALERKLHRAGVQPEIRSNPLTAALGITRLEVFVDERDLRAASNVCQGLAAAESEEESPRDLRGTRGFDGFVEPAQSELAIEATLIASPATEPRRDNGPESRPEIGGAEAGSDLVRATALLEKEVEALLARESKLVNRCSSLEEQVKALEPRLKASEQALADFQGRLESQARELSVRQARIADLEQQLARHARQPEQMIRERLRPQKSTSATDLPDKG